MQSFVKLWNEGEKKVKKKLEEGRKIIALEW